MILTSDAPEPAIAVRYDGAVARPLGRASSDSSAPSLTVGLLPCTQNSPENLNKIRLYLATLRDA